MRKLLFIVGPTATGKTGLGAFLAQKFSGEIISADSRQVFKGMDIVTGKDRPAGVRLHGYDLVKPDEDFSVAHFVAFAQPAIEKIWSRSTPSRFRQTITCGKSLRLFPLLSFLSYSSNLILKRLPA